MLCIDDGLDPLRPMELHPSLVLPCLHLLQLDVVGVHLFRHRPFRPVHLHRRVHRASELHRLTVLPCQANRLCLCRSQCSIQPAIPRESPQHSGFSQYRLQNSSVVNIRFYKPEMQGLV